MGRAPCCDKANVKKGPWSPEEDAKLKAYIEHHGTGGNWIALPQKIGLKRCGKSCRLRWLNYLRPNIKHGGFSEEEDNIICSLYVSIGSRWSIIAAQLPGRTDNDIKNYWNTRLKKKLLGKQRKEHHQARRVTALKHQHQPHHHHHLVSSSSGSGSGSGGGVITNQTTTTTTYWPPEHFIVAAAPMPPVIPNNNNNNGSINMIKQDYDQQLLNQLGGIRFPHHQPPPYDTPDIISFPQDQVYPTTMINPQAEPMVSSSDAIIANNNNNNNEAIITSNIFQGFEEFLIASTDDDLSHLVSLNPQDIERSIMPQLQGFYGMESFEMGAMSSGGSTNTTSTTTEKSTSWGDMTSLLNYSSSSSPNFDDSNTYFGIPIQMQ